LNIQITPQAYQQLAHAAQLRHTTPEKLVEDFAAEIADTAVYTNEDDFFRSLGMTDEDLKKADELAAQLPEHPNW
jgi:hypothetical protein